MDKVNRPYVKAIDGELPPKHLFITDNPALTRRQRRHAKEKRVNSVDGTVKTITKFQKK